jgi:fumarate reductase subunit D
MKPHTTAHRRDTLWLAALVHRISGIALACFLPLHFLVLGLAMEGEARLDGFLRWTEQPLVKLAEGGLVFLLAVHLIGGLRLIAMEVGPWRDGQKMRAVAAVAVAALVGLAFLIRAI